MSAKNPLIKMALWRNFWKLHKNQEINETAPKSLQSDREIRLRRSPQNRADSSLPLEKIRDDDALRNETDG